MTDAKTIDVTTDIAMLMASKLARTGPVIATGLCEQTANFIRALAADRDRLAAENARLREALDPFARAARIIDALPSEFRPEDDVGARDYLPRLWPDVGDLRRARAALGES